MGKLTREEKIKIFERRKMGETISSLAKDFNIHESNIKYLIALIKKHGYNVLRENKNKVYSKDFKLQIINRILVNHELIEGKTACNYSERFQCVMGTGLISFVEGKEEKAMALNEIMFQNMGKKDWDFLEEMLNRVAVFKVEVTNLSCKEHL